MKNILLLIFILSPFLILAFWIIFGKPPKD